MKFYNQPFAIDKSYAKNLEEKRAIFNARVVPNKTIFIKLITTFGMIDNAYSDALVQQQLSMDVLFKA